MQKRAVPTEQPFFFIGRLFRVGRVAVSGFLVNVEFEHLTAIRALDAAHGENILVDGNGVVAGGAGDLIEVHVVVAAVAALVVVLIAAAAAVLRLAASIVFVLVVIVIVVVVVVVVVILCSVCRAPSPCKHTMPFFRGHVKFYFTFLAIF